MKDYGEQEGTARCLECGEVIAYGRSDKKFCCEECKNRHHNALKSSSRLMKLRVLSALKHNYEILEALIADGVEQIEVSELKVMGFDAGYITSYIKYRRYVEMWCFDIKFIRTETKIKGISRVAGHIVKHYH